MRGWRAVTVLVIALPLMAAQSVDMGSLRFENDGPLVIAWDDVNDPGEFVEVIICNIGFDPIGPLTPRITGDVALEAVLELRNENRADLAPGECRPLHLAALVPADDNPLDPGTHSGLLVVTAEGGLARRQLTISGPPAGDALRFESSETLVLDWDDVVGGAQVRVCNNSGADTAAPTLSLTGFGFVKHDGTAAKDSSILVATIDPPGSIPPTADTANCPTTVTISRAEGQGRENPLLPRPGENPDLPGLPYTGLLVLTSGETITTRMISLSAAASTKYTGVIGTIDLRGHFKWPWSKDVQLTSSEFTLAYDADLGVPNPVPNRDVLLAHVANQGNVGRIRMLSAEPPDNGQHTYAVRLFGIREQGTLTGPLDFDLLDGAAEVSLKVRDHWGRLIGVLILGVIAGFIVRWINGRVLPLAALRNERSRIKKAYNNARTTFPTEPEWGETYTPPTEEGVMVFLRKSKSGVDAYASRSFLVDTTSTAHKELAQSLRDALTDARLLSTREPTSPSDDPLRTDFASKLQALCKKLADFNAWLKEQVSISDSPNFVYQATGLLIPSDDHELGVGGALKQAKTIDTYSNLVDTWKKMYTELQVHAQWAVRLAPLITDQEDRRRWEKAAIRILEVSDELFGVRTADELEAVGSKADLGRIYSLLARLGAEYDVIRPDWQPAKPSVAILSQAFAIDGDWATLRNHADLASIEQSIVDAASPDSLATWLQMGIPGAVGTLADVVVEAGNKARMIFAEVIALLLSVLGGSAVALWALYGDTFGSWANYFAVFAAGFALQIVIEGAIQAIQRRLDALGPAPAT